MTLTVLLASVEISDQMSRDKTLLVGVFDNARDIEDAKRVIEKRYRDRRIWWQETETPVNIICLTPPGSSLT